MDGARAEPSFGISPAMWVGPVAGWRRTPVGLRGSYENCVRPANVIAVEQFLRLRPSRDLIVTPYESEKFRCAGSGFG